MINNINSPLKEGDIVTYFLKPPSGKRISFSIIKRIKSADSTVSYSTFDNEQTKILNDMLHEGMRSVIETRKEFKEIIKALQENEKKRRGDLLACDENHLVMTKYLTSKYPPKKRREMDFKSAENETARTLRILGTKSIISIPVNEIQECVDRLEPRVQKRYVSRLHSILHFLGRKDVELFYSKAKKTRVTHITEADLKVLVREIKKETNNIAGITPNEFADFVITLFCTGMRIGESIALQEEDFFKSKYFIRVRSQIKQDSTVADTKNKKERRSIIFRYGIKSVENWINLDKSNFSRFQASKYLKKKTKQLFKDPNKTVTSHGLRHSYAIHLLRVLEVSISTVATFLGDSIKTTEDYYIDFIASDETIESVLRKM